MIGACICFTHLNASMAAQVEVELGRVCDGAIHCGACWDIATLPNLQEAIIKTCTVAQEWAINSSQCRSEFVPTLSALSEQKRRVWCRF